MQLLTVTVAQACEITGLGRTTIYEALRSGRLSARKCGRRTIIRVDDLRSWIDQMPAMIDADRWGGREKR
jgi:excisionase family DNA binding protein